MASQPTTGATEREKRSWQAWPGVALGIRFAAFVIPLIAAVMVVRIVSDSLYRSEGAVGLGLWLLQAAVIGMAVSLLVDRATRRLLPLAALFGMSIVFPDEAPSRFGVALRAGSVNRLRYSAARVRPIDPGTDPNEAAALALGLVADLARHDRLTRGHTERVRAYADMIGEEMELDEESRIRLSWAGLLHDVGKLTVPEPILNKPGRPTAQEWDVLSGHPAAALGLLGPLADWLGDWVLAATQHHERWDGEGYPAGLAGTDISLAGRIVAVADTYDVITSKRSYKEPLSAEAARRELVACSGTQFDPEVVRAFLNVSLGRRWLAGPFASFLDLPISSVGSAVSPLPAAVAAAAIAVGVGAPPATVLAEDVLAFETTVATQVDSTDASVTTADDSSAAIAPISSSDASNEPPVRQTTTTTTEPPTSAPSTQPADTPTTQPETTISTTSPTTTSTTSTTTTTSPTTTTTTSPTTTTTQPEPFTTTISVPPPDPASSPAAPLPTTADPASTTTSSAAPTTTTGPTTTTPPPGVYYLKNNGTGDTKFQWYNDLSTAEPDNQTLPNYDTDLDNSPGQGLLPTSNGLSEIDTRRKQTYVLAVGEQRLSGSVTGEVWVQPTGGGNPNEVRAVLRDCNLVGTTCTTLGDTSAVTVNSTFAPVTLDFGTITHDFEAGRRIMIILITEGPGALDVGFDADDAPSYFTLPLS